MRHQNWKHKVKHQKSLKSLFWGLLSLALIILICGIAFENSKGDSSIFTSTKPDTKPVNENNFNMMDTYYVPNSFSQSTMVLKTVNAYRGEKSKKIKYKVTDTPLVINAWYVKTSQVSSYFDIDFTKNVNGFDVGYIFYTSRYINTNRLIYAAVIEEKGNYTLEIESSGCIWNVIIGKE